MHRYKFVFYRPLQLLPVLFGISVITFILVRMIPGDPARVLLGTRATPSAIAKIRAEYGLDQPLWQQYFYFLEHLAHGEMGKSTLYKIDVLKLVLTRIELPLAVPVIIAGVRTAVVLTIGMAALAALIGGGGLGITIFSGIKLNQTPVLLIGAAIVILIALVFDYAGALAERFLKPRGL